MSHWWRAHDDSVDNPKLGLLSDRLFRCWYNLNCLASANRGKLPAIGVVAFKLRITEHKAAEVITALVQARLIDRTEDGFAPHNWNERQFRSDITDGTNADRQQRYRDRHRNGDAVTPTVTATVTPTVTPTVTVTATREQITETDTEKKTDSRAVAVATRPKSDQAFDEFWRAYPKREGANPRKPALAVFLAKLKAGAEAADILAGARACAAKDRDKIGTPFIPQAVKWLRDERWRDYLTPSSTGPPANGWRPGLPTDEELRAKYAKVNLEKADVSSDPPKPASGQTAERSIGTDHAAKLLREGVGAHPSERLGLRGGGEQPGAHGLGQLFHRPSALDAALPATRNDDDAGAMAAMVRS